MKYLLFFAAVFTFYGSDSNAMTRTSQKTNWEEYYQDTMHGIAPQPTLPLALRYFQREGVKSGKVVDLGAGVGKDTVFLLKAGWQVLALDAEQSSIDIILQRVKHSDLSNLKVVVSKFEEMTLPKELNLINASSSLPFCHPTDFDKCWENIVGSLAVGGRFSGQFYGKHDLQASNPNVTTLSRHAVMKLFKNRFKIEYLQIEDGLSEGSDGKMHPFHTYHIVAKKIL